MEKLQGAFANAAGRARKTLLSLTKPPSDPDAVILAFLNSAGFEQAIRESYQAELDAPPPFVAKPPKIVKGHPLRKKFKTTKEALNAGNYPDGHDSGINDTSYPMRGGMQEDVDLVGLDVNECFDHDPTTTELLALFAEHGYERPVYEDGLRDGAEYPKESYDRPHVYLHEPGAGSGVLVRGGWDGCRRLHRDFDDPGDHWDRRRCVFFVRRKSKA